MSSLTSTLPSALRLGLDRGAIEVRQFFRQREQVIFTFAFPVLILIVLGSITMSRLEEAAASTSQVFAASMLGAAIISTSFVTLGIGVALDRADGTLLRLRGTPMPAMSYFIGKIILVLVASVAEAVLVLAVGMLLFDITLPTEVDKWLTLVWVFLLAVISCSLLGIATSTLARSAQSGAAVANLPFVGLQFISGVYVTPITHLPGGMVTVASFFPVKWVSQGFRSVFLPESMAGFEMAGSWELGKVALVLGGWCGAGIVLCLLTFRWTDRRG
jgi:ABC-2 type transport system permease protein